jgi:hypothetical protein
MRGAGFAPALAAQRAYVEKDGRRPKLGLVVPEAFVRGIRDLGYRSNGDALAELIDNAVQAYADRVDVLFGFDGGTSTKKPAQVAVVDNGHGMEADMIRMAVMWGGTHRENDRNGLGRYGYGLPCAAVSLGRRFTVYSQTENSALHAVTVDLDRLTSGDYADATGEIVVPAAEVAALPSFVGDAISAAFPDGWRSGTVVLIEKLDRLEWTTVQGLRDNLCRQFGVTYHKLRGEAAIYVDGAFVEPIDPLFLTPGFKFYDLDMDRAFPLDPVRIEARDPDTGAYLGAVKLRYAWLPPSFGSADKERDAVGMNANERFAVMKQYHGLVFSRNGRLIDVQTRTPWTSFINNDRYIKVEVEFSATLDEAFGVTTSKQQVTVSPFAWELLLKAGLPKAIEQLRTKVREAKLARRANALAPPEGQRRLSERAMSAQPGALGMQGQLDLRPARYRTVFEHAPSEPFFKVDRSGGARTLHINIAHRFFTDVYDAPTATSDLRAALEIMLFAFGDAVLDAGAEQPASRDDRLTPWSRRLDQALEMLAAYLTAGEDEDAKEWLGVMPASGPTQDRP